MFNVVVPIYIDKTDKNEMLELLEKVEASAVALVVLRDLRYSFSSPEVLAQLKECVEFYRAHGYGVCIWVGQTIGHDTASDDERAFANFTTIKCIDSEHQNDAVFCPLDKDFASCLENWITDIAKCAPDLILLDDDYRQSYRGQGLGCCCDLHMARLCEVLGEQISREELRKKIFDGGKNKYRDAWLSVQHEGMTGLAAKLRTALDRVNPEIRMGFCLSPCGFDHDMDSIEVARALAGNTKPFVRTLGAPYWSTKANRRHLGEIVSMERMEIAWCREAGIESIAEGDNFPRPRFATPAAYVEVFESILRADGANDGILKYFFDPSGVAYEPGYVTAAVRCIEVNKQIAKLFEGKTRGVGLRPYNVRQLLGDAVIDADEPGVLTKWERALYYPSLNFATVTSMPIAFDGNGVNILFGENARHISHGELKNGSVIDIEAAQILMERGIDVGIAELDMSTSVGVKETFSAIYEYDLRGRGFAIMRGDVPIYSSVKREGAVIVSQFEINESRYDGVFAYRNADGESFLVYPFSAEKARSAKNWFNSYFRRDQLTDSFTLLSGAPCPVYDMGKNPMLYILAKEGEDGMAVGLWNICEDRIDGTQIHVEGEFKDISFVGCTGELCGNTVTINSVIYPYEFAGFELKK